MYLALLIGNTTVRYATFDDPGDLRFERSGHEAWASITANAKPLIDVDADRVEAVVVGSVRDDLFAQLGANLPSGLPAPLFAGRDFAIPIDNEYERPEEVGIDRLLNALAAHRRAGARGAVVVDFGTAVSVSVVSPGGVFLGGAIAAGLPALVAGLTASTPRLPQFDPDFRKIHPEQILGRSTVDALHAGLYSQVVGGVSKILSGLMGELEFSNPAVFATGGDAARFASEIDLIDAIVPDLTLEGLVLAYDGSRSQ